MSEMLHRVWVRTPRPCPVSLWGRRHLWLFDHSFCITNRDRVIVWEWQFARKRRSQGERIDD